MLIPINHLAAHISTLPRQHQTLLIGIDGCGASGKSTLAKALQSALAGTTLSDTTIIQMDDFILPSAQRQCNEKLIADIGLYFDWSRVQKQVLEPLQRNLPSKYQRYDWPSDSMAEWHTVPVGGIVIIEGVYSTRKELADFYDMKIWVDCPHDLRLMRGLQRDGEKSRSFWEDEWMPAEERYVESQKPSESADLIIDGSKSSIMETGNFVCIEDRIGLQN